MDADYHWTIVAMTLYATAAVAAVLTTQRRRVPIGLPMGVLALALAVHTIAIAIRWERLGHGPYVDLFEVLSSNVWSLHVAVLVSALLIPRIRPTLATSLPVLQVMVLWLLSLTPVDTQIPVTYHTPLLAVHVWLGKIFLGCIVVAVGLSLVMLARRLGIANAFATLPVNDALDELAYRFVLIAFLFESLMLVAGAVWARDAWGRYWAWDPLETWAFITWLSVIAFLHLRSTRRPSPTVSALMIVGIFILGFSTLFGMPFISMAPHKGAI